MTSKIDTAITVADDKRENASSLAGDLEGQPGDTQSAQDGHLKRDLASRHINMIAIAGMIVCESLLCPDITVTNTECRAQVSSSAQVEQLL